MPAKEAPAEPEVTEAPETNGATPKVEAFILPLNTAQALMNHLSRQPYADVFQLVDALRNLQPATIVEQ